MKADGVSQKITHLNHTGKKAVALLLDPEHIETSNGQLLPPASAQVDFVFVGGSLVSRHHVGRCVSFIKERAPHLPVVLFPGSAIQVVDNADAILFLSLISGRNPDFLIGQQVTAAPFLAKSSLEILPTGYLLVDGGGITSVHYISQTIPLPNDKSSLAVATAKAGIFLGMKYLYLDAGSGAKNPVSAAIIAAVKHQTKSPLIVGGGIDSKAKAKAAWEAGADIVVVGNGVEKNPDLLAEVIASAQTYNLSLNVN